MKRSKDMNVSKIVVTAEDTELLAPVVNKNPKKKRKGFSSNEKMLIVLASLGLAWLAVFAYAPMFGVLLAFKDADMQLNVWDALFHSDWVGFDNFRQFFIDPSFRSIFWNTLGLNSIGLLINFPAPIIFALLINEIRLRRFRAGVQTVANFPHFISWTVFGGLIIALCDMTTGIMNPILNAFGLSSNEDPVNLLSANYFWLLVILSSLLKGVGWGSIVYVAAISGIDPTYYEAATLDGANRFQKAIYITLPSIAGTITIFLLMSISGILGNNFEQFYTLQNSINLSRSEVLATYVYKMGLMQRRYAYSSALGLFNSVISFSLLVLSNFISKKISGRGLY